MTSVELSDAEKAMRKPNGDAMEPKDFIICPLTFRVTHGQAAVNYDISPTTVEKGGEKVPGWRSQPQKRSHTKLFQAGLQALKDKGLIPKEWVAYFFSDSQGREARVAYEDKVLKGEVTANRRSWGPNNSDQKPDKSRYHILVTRERVDEMNKAMKEEKGEEWSDLTYPVTFDQLIERYPELYGSSKKKTSETEKSETVPDLDLGAMDDDTILKQIQGDTAEEARLESEEPDPEELKIAAAEVEEELEEVEEAEEAVAASTTLEDATTAIEEEDALLEGLEEDTATAAPPQATAEKLESARTGNIPASEVRQSSHRTEEGQVTRLDATDQKLKGQEITSDVIMWTSQSGEVEVRYLVFIDALEREEWVREGESVIDGEDINLIINRK